MAPEGVRLSSRLTRRSEAQWATVVARRGSILTSLKANCRVHAARVTTVVFDVLASQQPTSITPSSKLLSNAFNYIY